MCCSHSSCVIIKFPKHLLREVAKHILAFIFQNQESLLHRKNLDACTCCIKQNKNIKTIIVHFDAQFIDPEMAIANFLKTSNIK